VEDGGTHAAVERRMKGDVSVKAWAAQASGTSGRSFIVALSEADVVDCWR
jgi:hypothetical protein